MLRLLPLCVLLLTACDAGREPTVLVRNATIVDGTGSAQRSGDVRFNRDGIIEIGDLEVLPSDRVVAADGLVLAPGFIDTHSHMDDSLGAHPDARAAVSQGITTVVVGNDGSSALPITSLRTALEHNPPAVNVASYTGHGSLRNEVMGGAFRREATDEEIARMQALLLDDLQHGSLGLATGLEYDPGIYSSTDEVIALAQVAADQGGRYISHMRSEDRYFHEAVDELLLIGRETGIPVQISHLKLAAIDIWGQAGDVLERLEQARSEGIDVTADVYPYTYWQSTLTVLLPDRDFEDLEEARFVLQHLAPADGLTLADYAPNPKLVGMTVAEIATQWEMRDEETYLKLIRDAYEGLSDEDIAGLKASPESVIGVSMSEADVARLIAWEHTNICSDGARDGHPRGHGAFPRAIRKYVNETPTVSLEEMIRKMTSLGAAHVGIAGRGAIRAGYAADLVLFDPATIADNATIGNGQLLSDGIVGVWVNGERVWQDGAPTGSRPGVFLGR